MLTQLSGSFAETFSSYDWTTKHLLKKTRVFLQYAWAGVCSESFLVYGCNKAALIYSFGEEAKFK